MRTRPWQILLLALVIVLALGLWQRRRQTPASPTQETVTAPTSQSEQPKSQRFVWKVGTTETYQLSTRRVVHMRSRGEPASDDSFALSVTAHYSTTVLRSDDFMVMLVGQFSDLKLELPGEPAARAKLLQDLGRPFVLLELPDGKLRSLRLHNRVDAVGRSFLKALLASLQFVRPGPGQRSWSSEELDATGEYEAKYQLDPDGKRCHKSRSKYLQVRAAAGLMPVAQLGKVGGVLDVTYTLANGDDEAARLLGIEGRDTLDLDPGPQMPLVSSDSTLRLVRISSHTGTPQPLDLALLESPEYQLSPLALMDTTDTDRRADEQKVGGASFADLLQALRTLPATDNGSHRAELQTRLSSLFRVQPDAAKQAAQAIGKGVPEPVAKTLLGALSGAQSEAGQAALVEVINNRALSTDLRENAVAVLGLSEPPTEATSQALQKALRDGDPDVRGTAALALGNAAGAQRQAGQLGAADANVDVLIERFQSATTEAAQTEALEALGNTGDPRILPYLQSALQSPSVAIRVAAAHALRFVVAPPVDPLLAQLLDQDQAAEVRQAAIMACSFRQMMVFFPSLQKVLLYDKSPAVRLEALQLLARSRELAGVQQLLRTVAERDPDPNLRRAAADHLNWH